MKQDYSKTLIIASDYGGVHKSSRHSTYTFVVCSYQLLRHYFDKIHAIREECDLNVEYRDVTFKNLNDNMRVRAIEKGWLSALDSTPGMVFTLIVDNSLSSVVNKNSPEAQRALALYLEKLGVGKWKPRVAERLIVITHIAAYLVGLLSRPGQNVFWLSDRDEIFGSDEQKKAVGALFGNLLRYYTNFDLGKVGYGTEFEKRERRKSPKNDVCQLVDAADLVAGCVEDLYSKHESNVKEIMVKGGADKVLQWLSYQGIFMKKHTISIKGGHKGEWKYAYVYFHLNEPLKNSVMIPYVRRVIHKRR